MNKRGVREDEMSILSSAPDLRVVVNEQRMEVQGPCRGSQYRQERGPARDWRFTMQCRFLVSILALLSLAAPAWASVIYVSGDQIGTWSADTVMVTADVCVPPGQNLTIVPGVMVLFQGHCGLIVYNGAALRAVGTLADSIRFDVLPPSTSWHGIRFLSASGSSRLEYCSLTHGYADEVSGQDNYGGAIYCAGSSPTIHNNTIRENQAYVGGGISCEEGSNPSIVGNHIEGNGARYGCGINCTNSSPSIIGNVISGGASALGGGGAIGCGPGSSPSIIGNVLSGNRADWGGGIACGPGSGPIIDGNTIVGNSATAGGGISASLASPSITHNLIIRNAATYGGGIWLDGYTNVGIIGNTVSGNHNDGIRFSSASATMVNCILWGNTPYQVYWFQADFQATYCNIQQDGFAGLGNINADPLFVNAPQDDYHLQSGSPCIDSGDPNPIYNDPDGTRADMGAFYYDQLSPSRVDELSLQAHLHLAPNQPNPFRWGTRLSYSLPAPGHVRLLVLDPTGRRVASLVDRTEDAGEHVVDWDARDGYNQRIPSGVYFARLEYAESVRTVRLASVR